MTATDAGRIDRLLNEAINTRGYSEGDLRSLVRSLADLVKELAPKPADRNVTVRCVYGKCGGASFTSEDATERDEWMDGHVRVAPHSDRWPVTFALEYASGNSSVAYRDAVTIDS